ncbi:unnamed protein product [Ectocarpus sp. 8 AP-2014]
MLRTSRRQVGDFSGHFINNAIGNSKFVPRQYHTQEMYDWLSDSKSSYTKNVRLVVRFKIIIHKKCTIDCPIQNHHTQEMYDWLSDSKSSYTKNVRLVVRFKIIMTNNVRLVARFKLDAKSNSTLSGRHARKC